MRLRPLLTLLLLVSLLAACGGGDPEVEATEAPVAEVTSEPDPEPTEEPTKKPTPEATEEPGPVAPLTGEAIEDEALFDLSVVAVKIDNDADARPQVGLADADVVIVEPIEGLTRLVAILHSDGSGEVGPVRSGRRVDPQLFGAFEPIFAFSGAAGPNYPAIDGGFPNTVVNDRSQAGWRREGTRSAPHNLFIPLETIRERFPDATGPGATPVFAFDEATPAGGTATDGFTVDYGRFRTQSGWTWSDDGWVRSQDGTPHLSGEPDRNVEGAPIVAANVVVLTVETTGSQAEPVVVLGEGPVRIHRDGQVFEGTWSKPTAEDQYRFTTADGSDLPLAPGATWLEIHPTSGTYVPGAPVVETDATEG